MPEVYNSKKQGGDIMKHGTRQKKRHPRDYSEVMAGERQTTSPLATFSVRPSGVRFETQEREEEVLLLLRRHVITNLGWILIVILLFLAPLVLGFFPLLESFPGRFLFITLVTWYLMIAGYGLEQFLSWYFNVYIITDERIIDIDFHNLIYKEIAAAKIENIEDVTFKIGGALRNVLNFGTIYIQTAGEKREFDFEDVPRPEVVSKFINEMILEEEKEKMEGRVR